MTFAEWKDELLIRASQYQDPPRPIKREPELNSAADFERAFGEEIDRLHKICRQVNRVFGCTHYVNLEGRRLLNELMFLKINIARFLSRDAECDACGEEFKAGDDIETIHENGRMFAKHKECCKEDLYREEAE